MSVVPEQVDGVLDSWPDNIRQLADSSLSYLVAAHRFPPSWSRRPSPGCSMCRWGRCCSATPWPEPRRPPRRDLQSLPRQAGHHGHPSGWRTGGRVARSRGGAVGACAAPSSTSPPCTGFAAELAGPLPGRAGRVLPSGALGGNVTGMTGVAAISAVPVCGYCLSGCWREWFRRARPRNGSCRAVRHRTEPDGPRVTRRSRYAACGARPTVAEDGCDRGRGRSTACAPAPAIDREGRWRRACHW